MTIIEFGEYTPDLPSYGNPGATEAKNVIPAGNSYLPFNSLEVFSNALDARCQGFGVSRDYNGDAFAFAGDTGKLYKLTSATWSDVSVVGGYTVASDQHWKFSQWGEQFIATQIAQYPQTFTMGTSTTFSNLTTDLKARYGASVRDFMVFAHTFDATDGTVPIRVRWSAIGDPTDYTVSATTQSDFQDLSGSGGFITGLVGGEYGTIFMENAVYRMTYTGSATIFDFDEVEQAKGCPAPGSIIKVGALIYYLADDGFYVFDGNTSQEVSHNRISKTFWDDVNTDYLDRISSMLDLNRQVVMWSYPSKVSQDGTPDKVIIYNYASSSKRRWSWAELQIDILGTVITGGYTLDGLDAINTSIDEITPSLDSRYWSANDKNVAAFGTDFKLATFSGTPLDAVLETGEVEFALGRRARLTRLIPLVDGASGITIQVSGRNRQQDAITWSAEASTQSSGTASVRSNNRYHRIRANITGGFTHAQGIEPVDISQAGKR